jgi:hypothetical protein
MASREPYYSTSVEKSRVQLEEGTPVLARIQIVGSSPSAIK